MNVRIGELPRYHVAYMRHVGPYGAHGIPALWKRLHEWTRTRGLDTPDSIKLGIGHDDPDVTAVEKCRYDACVVVSPDFAGDKWVTSWTCREARWRSACSPAPPTRSRTRGARSIGHGCPAAATSPTIDRVSRSTAATRKSPGGPARFAASSASR